MKFEVRFTDPHVNSPLVIDADAVADSGDGFVQFSTRDHTFVAMVSTRDMLAIVAREGGE